MPDPLTVPMSARQRHDWAAVAGRPADASRQIATTYAVRGPLDPPRLAEALLAVLGRHDQLRLRVTGPADAPTATVLPAPAGFPLPVVDLDGLDDPTRDRLVAAYQERDAATPVDIRTGWPLRAVLLRLAPRRHLLLLTVHHLVADGWSVGVVGRDLATAYRTGTLATPPPPSYAEFAAAEPAQLAGPAHRAQLRWWVDQLRAVPPVPRFGSAPTVVTGDTIEWRNDLPAQARQELRGTMRAAGASTFAVAVAAVAASLSHRTGARCWPMWVSHAGRRLPDFAGTVGLFSNRLPLVVRVPEGASLVEVARGARAGLFDLLEHSEPHFFTLLAAVPALRQVQLLVQHLPAAALDTGDPAFTFRRYRVAASPVDVHLPLYELPDGAMWWGGESRTDVLRPAEAKALFDGVLADHCALLVAPYDPVDAVLRRQPA